jgi:hypothetical protein
MVCPELVRPEVSQREEYADDGDIWLFLDEIKKIDAKGNPDYAFTMNNWPGEGRDWKTIIVESVHNIDKRKRTYWRTFQVNQQLSCAIVINPETSKHLWTKRLAWDSKAGRRKWYYFCPITHTIFINLDT